MNTKPARQFPDSLGGIQFGTVGRQEIQAEPLGLLLSPVPVQAGVMILGVVGNHHCLPRSARAGGTKLLQKLPAGQGVELPGLCPEEETPIAQADRSIVTHALAVGRVKQNRVPGLGRHPHLTARTVLLKMHFVHSPKVNRGIEA